jgi:hypothetical protein
MTKPLGHYKFSADEIARHVCLDCGVNVIEIGDYVMLSPRTWEGTLGLDWDDNLCIACVEKRLGRQLGWMHGDFCSLPSVKGNLGHADGSHPSGLARAAGRGGEEKATQAQVITRGLLTSGRRQPHHAKKRETQANPAV